MGLDPSSVPDDELFAKIRKANVIIEEYVEFYPQISKHCVLFFLEHTHIEFRSFIFDLPILNRRIFFRRKHESARYKNRSQSV